MTLAKRYQPEADSRHAKLSEPSKKVRKALPHNLLHNTIISRIRSIQVSQKRTRRITAINLEEGPKVSSREEFCSNKTGKFSSVHRVKTTLTKKLLSRDILLKKSVIHKTLDEKRFGQDNFLAKPSCFKARSTISHASSSCR